ncbi:MAG: hypothetical protein M3271_03595 [Actinomycetota bacterium]|nr:hypothetical protein [Actinomycetota bacterium]
MGLRRDPAWGRALLDYALAVVAGVVTTLAAIATGAGARALVAVPLSLVCAAAFAVAARRVGVSPRDYWRHRRDPVGPTP